MLLFSAQFVSLALTRNYAPIAITFVLAGLGNALCDPARSGSILDRVPSSHSARVLSLKITAGSVGNIVERGLAVRFTPALSARGIFLLSTRILLLIAVTVGVAGRGIVRGEQAGESPKGVNQEQKTVS